MQYKDISGAKGQFLGWWAVMTQAAFSFIGTEITAVSNSASCTLFSSVPNTAQIAAGEAKNPRKNLPKVISTNQITADVCNHLTAYVGHKTRLHPYPFILHRRCHSYRTACAVQRPGPQFGDWQCCRLALRHCHQERWNQGSPISEFSSPAQSQFSAYR